MDYTLILYVLILIVCCFTTYTARYDYFETCESYNSNIFRMVKTFALPIIFFSLFWGLRDHVGTDYNSYCEIYDNPDFYHSIGQIELGFTLLIKSLKSLGFGNWSLFFICSLINVASIFSLARERDNNFAVLLMYFFFTSTLVLFATNGLRQMLAISLFFISFSAIGNESLKKNVIVVILFAIIGFLFHKSSIIAFLLLTGFFLFPKIKINKHILSIIYICVYFVGIKYQSMFFSFFDNIELINYGHQLDKANQMMEDMVQNSFGIGSLIKLLLGICLIESKDTIYEQEDKRLYYVYNLLLVGLMLECIFSGNNMLIRLIMYFTSLKIIVFTYVCYYHLFLINDKRLFSYLIIIMNFLVYIVSILNNSNDCVPYNTIIFQ